MLIQFSAENFLSLRDKAILSMEPSADKEHVENILSRGKYKALNIAAIYGANASGKSSLYKALTTALVVIRTSNVRQINDLVPVTPFRFNNEKRNSPSRFEFVFVAEDGKKYIYGYAADQHKIWEEYLYCYNSAKPSLIFERDGENTYKFSRDMKKVLEPVVRMNTANKLFLATATAWNAEATAIPYKWLSESIDSYTNDENMTRIALDMYRRAEEKYVPFTKSIMKQADISIDDIQVESEKMDPSKNPMIPSGIIVGGQLIPMQEQYQVKITTGHIVNNENNLPEMFNLALGEESVGTQLLFFLAPLLKDTFEKGKTLVVDEIDRSLHPFIVKFIANLFRNKEVNVNGAQLIFTTHETTLLSLDTFRRDQVYFTEKDAASGATDLYSLDEYPVRKGENIEKGYLLGRYGAIPFLHTEEIV